MSLKDNPNATWCYFQIADVYIVIRNANQSLCAAGLLRRCVPTHQYSQAKGIASMCVFHVCRRRKYCYYCL